MGNPPMIATMTQETKRQKGSHLSSCIIIGREGLVGYMGALIAIMPIQAPDLGHIRAMSQLRQPLQPEQVQYSGYNRRLSLFLLHLVAPLFQLPFQPFTNRFGKNSPHFQVFSMVTPPLHMLRLYLPRSNTATPSSPTPLRSITV